MRTYTAFAVGFMHELVRGFLLSQMDCAHHPIEQ